MIDFGLIHLIMAVTGVAVGIVFGALPGADGRMAIAVFLPLTYAYDLLVSPFPAHRALRGRHQRQAHPGHPGEHPRNALVHLHRLRRPPHGEAGRRLQGASHRHHRLPDRGAHQSVRSFPFHPAPGESLSTSLRWKNFSPSSSPSRSSPPSPRATWSPASSPVFLGVLVALIGQFPDNNRMRMVPDFLSVDLRSGFQLLPVLIGLFALVQILQEARAA